MLKHSLKPVQKEIRQSHGRQRSRRAYETSEDRLMKLLKSLLWLSLLVELSLTEETVNSHESTAYKSNHSVEQTNSSHLMVYGTGALVSPSVYVRNGISEISTSGGDEGLSPALTCSTVSAQTDRESTVDGLSPTIVKAPIGTTEHSDDSSLPTESIDNHHIHPITASPQVYMEHSTKLDSNEEQRPDLENQTRKDSQNTEGTSYFPKGGASDDNTQTLSDSLEPSSRNDNIQMTTFELSTDTTRVSDVTTDTKTLTTESLSVIDTPKSSFIIPDNWTLPLQNTDQFTDYNESLMFNDDFGNELDSSSAQFLSFEDWKKAKGVDSGKSAEEFPQSRPLAKPNTENGVIGEEMEIDLSNFFDASEQEPEGKLYKDKFNFASFDCAATIVKTNSEAKGATSILFESKESYLLNPCSAPNKFVTIELCQDILVDSVVVGNFEFFSSTFKKISISVSESFPVPKNGWKNLGVFEAKDVRDFQTFNIENPMIWAKYFRIEILEHYGNEYYCPLSVVRVHGRTMMQEYKQEESRKQDKKLEPQNDSEGFKSGSQNDSISTSCNDTCNVEKKICLADTKPKNNTNYTDHLSSGGTADLISSDFNECATTLPMLRFEEFFNQFNNQSKCEETKPSSIPSPKASVGTQESIYKNIMKRLTLLESNATLSVLYIEEQSKLLSQAFASLEKKQSQKLSQLTTNFNNNIIDQIKVLQDIYQVFQQETEKYFQSEKSNHETMMKTTYETIDSLKSELKFQKILTFINLLIIVGVLIYVIITRDTYIDTEYVENDKFWVDQQRLRVTSTGSRLKTGFSNLTKYYYSPEGSVKSGANSDNEEIDQTTRRSNLEGLELTSTKEGKFNDDESAKTSPLTPDNSDDEA